jgi:hypothetical protein
MTQQASPMDRAADYLHHQGAKSFEELEVLLGQSSDNWAACRILGSSEDIPKQGVGTGVCRVT